MNWLSGVWLKVLLLYVTKKMSTLSRNKYMKDSEAVLNSEGK